MHLFRGCSLNSFQIIIFSHEFVPLHLEKVQIIPKLLYFIDLYTVWDFTVRFRLVTSKSQIAGVRTNWDTKYPELGLEVAAQRELQAPGAVLFAVCSNIKNSYQN